MLDAAEQALAFVRGRTRADLADDVMFRMALVRVVEIVGEAAARTTETTRSEIPGVPWNQVVGMRNRLVHAYFDVDQDILWNTVEKAFPDLAKVLRAALDRA